MPIAEDPTVHLLATGQEADAGARLEEKGSGEGVATDAEVSPHVVVEAQGLGGGAALGVSAQERVAVEHRGARDPLEDEARVAQVAQGGERGAGQEGCGDGGVVDEVGAEETGVDLEEVGFCGAGSY